MKGRLYIIFTDEVDGEWKVLRGETDKETLETYERNWYRVADRQVPFVTKRLVREIGPEEATKPSKLEDQLKERSKSVIMFDAVGKYAEFYLDDLMALFSQALSDLSKEIEEAIEVSRGNDYHNIGMGSLDYHEKTAVDCYIETLKHRLHLAQKREEER